MEFPEQGYCLLIRSCAPVRDPESGEPWTDASDRVLWTSEGICLRYEERSLFRLVLPSVLLGLSRSESTFLQQFYPDVLDPDAHASHADAVEIDNALFFDPMRTDGTFRRELLCGSDSPETVRALDQITHAVHHTGELPQFAFGPASEACCTALRPRIVCAFPLPEHTPMPSDRLGVYRVTPAKPVRCTEKPAVLQCCFEPDSDSDTVSYQWALCDIPEDQSDGDILLAGPVLEASLTRGISLERLETDAEYIRAFAESIGWVPRPSAPGNTRDYYRFTRYDRED